MKAEVLFGPDGHLSEWSAALCVDALKQGNYSSLAEAIRGHVEACFHCQGVILDVQLFLQHAGEAGDRVLNTPEIRVRRADPVFVRLAAAVAVLAVALTLFVLFQRSHSPVGNSVTTGPTDISSPSVQRPDSGPDARTEAEPVRQPRMSAGSGDASFSPNANLESMIGSRSRSLSTQLLAPAGEVPYSHDIVFSWETTARDPLQLKILSNRNEVIFAFTVGDPPFVFRERLFPGLYYWKLESRADLLAVGKFSVRPATSPTE